MGSRKSFQSGLWLGTGKSSSTLVGLDNLYQEHHPAMNYAAIESQTCQSHQTHFSQNDQTEQGGK